MTRKNLWIAVLMILVLSCDKDDNTIEETPQGYNMLLIGNSFFKPYAEKLDDIAELAKFENHSSLLITRGGDNGRPINFWNDSNSNAHLQIKAALDQGDIDIFGMTAGHEPEDRTEGHRAWINYAIQNNPNKSQRLLFACCVMYIQVRTLSVFFGRKKVGRKYVRPISVFDRQIFRPNKNSAEKNFGRKNFGRKTFRPKIFRPKFFRPKISPSVSPKAEAMGGVRGGREPPPVRPLGKYYGR